MTRTLPTRLLMRNDTIERWEENDDIVLLRGEIGVAFDSNGHASIKIGDGVRSWKELGFIGFEINERVSTHEIQTTVDEQQYIDILFGGEYR